MIKILFVCTGNICRSPTAEGVFRHLAAKSGMAEHIRAGSAGIDTFHEGEKPDQRAIKIAARNGISLEGIRARKLVEKDYFDFDYIFAMDGGHLFELEERAPEHRKAIIEMFLKSAGHLRETEVPDPWYGSEKDFDKVFNLIQQGAAALLTRLKEEYRL